MSLDRKPALAAVRNRLANWDSNVMEADIVYRFVNLALDTVEEQIATETAHLNEYWVITYTGAGRDTVMSVCSTRARARRAVTQLMKAWDENRKNYIIHRVPGLEVVK